MLGSSCFCYTIPQKVLAPCIGYESPRPIEAHLLSCLICHKESEPELGLSHNGYRYIYICIVYVYIYVYMHRHSMYICNYMHI